MLSTSDPSPFGVDRRRALRDGHGRRPAGINLGRRVAAGNPGCVPEQPPGASVQRTAATRTVSGGSFADLNEDLLGDETLVACAAAGTTATDGRRRNSPYTAPRLWYLETPLEIGLLFRQVRAQVLEATNGAQRPHEYQSLVGEHYLTRTLATGASTTVTAVIPADPAPVSPTRGRRRTGSVM